MRNNRTRYILDISDFIILLFIFFAIIIGDVRENEFYGNILRGLAVTTAMFHYGRVVYLCREDLSELWKKFGLFAILYLIIGVIGYSIIRDERMLQGLSYLVTVSRVPLCDELFFTVAVILFFSAVLAKHLDIFIKYKKIWIAIGILMLGIPYVVNSDLIGYPLLGVFIGCYTFECVPILPAMIYFLIGIYSEVRIGSNDKEYPTDCRYGIGGDITVVQAFEIFGKKPAIVSFIVSVIGVAMLFTPLKWIGIYLAPAFFVYLTVVICPKMRVFKFLLKLYEHIIAFFIKVVRSLIDRFREGGKRNLPVYLLVYTCGFVVMCWFVYSVFRENGNSLIWVPDGIATYYTKAYGFIEHVRDAVAGMAHGDFSIPSFDFNAGLGGAIPLVFEPLYFLMALFPPEKAELAFHVVYFARLYCVGLSASVLFLFYKNKYFESLIGSYMYMFCGYVIAETVRHPQFCMPMIFLPLLILMTEEMLHKRRWWLCPPLIGLSLACGYYFHYINTLLIIIYFIVRYMYMENKSIKDFCVRTLRFAGAYILGVAIGNITLVTSFASFLSSTRKGETVIATRTILNYGSSWIRKNLGSFISLPDSPAYLVRYGFAAFALIAVVVLFIKAGKRYRFLRGLIVIMTIMCMFPVVGLVFNGFGAVINRWTYAYALAIAATVVYVLPDINKLSKKQLKTLFLVLVPYAIYIILDREMRTEGDAISLAILFISFAIVVMMNENIRIIAVRGAKIGIALLICLSICVNAYFQYTYGSDTSENGVFVKKNGALTYHENTMFYAFKDSAKDTTKLERVATTGANVNVENTPTILNYYGITEYTNTNNSLLIEYLDTVGASNQSITRFRGFNNLTMINELANVKYYVDSDDTNIPVPYGYSFLKDSERKHSGGTFDIYENDMYLPFGYTYDKVIDQASLEDYPLANRQEVLMQAATVKNAKDSTAANLLDETSSTGGTSADSDASGSGEKSEAGETSAFGEDNAADNSMGLSTKSIKLDKYELNNCELVDGHLIKINDQNSSIKLYFNAEKGKELYIRWKGTYAARNSTRDARGKATFTLDNGRSKLYDVEPFNYAYYDGYGEYIFNLGYQTEDVTSCTIDFLTPDPETSSEEYACINIEDFEIIEQSMDSYPDYVANLAENHLEDLNIGDDKITGKLSLDEEKLLVLSIPIIKGWTAYIDDEPAEILQTNIMFMGIDVPAGDHEIRFEYHRPGIKLSIMISVAAIAVYVGLIVVLKRRKRNGV